MKYQVRFSEEAFYQLKKLDNKTAKRILDKIDATLEDPFHFFTRLSGREEYKLRIGDYRVICKILTNEKTIFVFSLGHRKNIYKKMHSKKCSWPHKPGHFWWIAGLGSGRRKQLINEEKS